MRAQITFAWWCMALSGSLAVSRTAWAQQASAEQTVRALDDQERLAVLHGDRAALDRLWSQELTVNAPTNRVNVGRAAVLAVIQRGGLHYSVFERTVEAVRVDGDVAIVMGAETVRPADADSSAAPIHRRFTNVWKRADGTWRLIARHANAIAAH